MGVNKEINSTQKQVALHPEGVDRNYYTLSPTPLKPRVALHPEGVDRNFFGYDIANLDRGRPPPGGRG